ncbi:MAG: serine hydrolase [Alphaproteobacteria bacterium]|nr:MAG: serine hydrolase [Alphaproteobacteria bacterium]
MRNALISGLAQLLLVPAMIAQAPAAAAYPCAAAAAYSAARGGVSLIIMLDGVVVCEDYPNGGAADQAHFLASGTKSFTGVIAAAAVQDGLLRFDELVSDTLTEWQGDPVRMQITVRHLLTLSSGLEPGGNGAPPSFATAVASRSVHNAGERFEYGPAPFQIFGELMRRKLLAAGRDGDPLSYLQARVLSPIGVTPAFWRRDSDGMANMPSGAALTARQWAAVGEFVRLGGVVGGQALVDPEALRALFEGTDANPGYGMSWWLIGRPGLRTGRGELAPGGPEAGDEITISDAIMAAGAGKQRLYVIPSRGLTIVRQTDRAASRGRGDGGRLRWSDAAFLEAILGDD